jgi:hypothetical protein
VTTKNRTSMQLKFQKWQFRPFANSCTLSRQTPLRIHVDYTK